MQQKSVKQICRLGINSAHGARMMKFAGYTKGYEIT